MLMPISTVLSFGQTALLTRMLYTFQAADFMQEVARWKDSRVRDFDHMLVRLL